MAAAGLEATIARILAQTPGADSYSGWSGLVTARQVAATVTLAAPQVSPLVRALATCELVRRRGIAAEITVTEAGGVRVALHATELAVG